MRERFERACRGEAALGPAAFAGAFIELLLPAVVETASALAVEGAAGQHGGLPSVTEDLSEVSVQVFQALDLNQDGSIDLREFVAGMSTMLRGTPAPLHTHTDCCRTSNNALHGDSSAVSLKMFVEAEVGGYIAI